MGEKASQKETKTDVFPQKLLKSIKAGLQLPPTSVKGPVA